MTTLSFRLPGSLAVALEKGVSDAERSKSFIIRKAVEAYLGDYADLQIALDRLRDTSDSSVSSRDMR